MDEIKRPTIDEYFMMMAILASSRSTCSRRKVGAILVDANNFVLSTGYNGVPKGFSHCTDVPCSGSKAKSGTNLDACMATHAEVNALIQCKDSQAIETIYTTTSPCISCTKMLLNTSCQRIVYHDEYPTNGMDMWLNVDREWEQITDE